MPRDSTGTGVAEIRPQPSDDQRVELRLNNFDEPEPDRYYEPWFASGDRRISAGSFTSVGRGETRVWLNAPPEARSFDTLLITEERLGERASGTEVALKGKVPGRQRSILSGPRSDFPFTLAGRVAW